MQKYENRRPMTVGSSRIRGNAVMKYCPEIVEFQNGVEYGAVIYQKAFWKEHMQLYKGIKIFDICDPVWLEGRPITEVIENVDAITCSTDALTKYLVQLTDKPVITIPDRVDPEEYFPTKEAHIGKARSVVWFGYSQNHVVLDQVLQSLKRLNLKLVVISDRAYRDADVNIKWDVATVYKDIIEHDMVINPAFTKDLRFTFKSNNKTLSSWALKMPVANDAEQMERFLDPKEREKESSERYAEVVSKWHVKESGPQYLELIQSIISKKGSDQ